MESSQPANWRKNLSLSEMLYYMFTNQFNTDFTIVLFNESKKKVVPVHKLILVRASPVFEAMFRNDYKEINKNLVNVECHNFYYFDLFLRYLYTEDIKKWSVKTAIGLYELADKYEVDGLMKLCLQSIPCNTRFGDLCSVYEFGVKYGIKSFEKISLEAIKFHTTKVINCKSFRKVQAQTVSLILDQPTLNVDELELFNAVSKFIDFNEKQGANVEELRSKLIPKICFLNMSGEQFVEGPLKSNHIEPTAFKILPMLVSPSGKEFFPPGYSQSLRESHEPITDVKPGFVYFSMLNDDCLKITLSTKTYSIYLTMICLSPLTEGEYTSLFAYYDFNEATNDESWFKSSLHNCGNLKISVNGAIREMQLLIFSASGYEMLVLLASPLFIYKNSEVVLTFSFDRSKIDIFQIPIFSNENEHIIINECDGKTWFYFLGYQVLHPNYRNPNFQTLLSAISHFEKFSYNGTYSFDKFTVLNKIHESVLFSNIELS